MIQTVFWYTGMVTWSLLGLACATWSPSSFLIDRPEAVAQRLNARGFWGRPGVSNARTPVIIAGLNVPPINALTLSLPHPRR